MGRKSGAFSSGGRPATSKRESFHVSTSHYEVQARKVPNPRHQPDRPYCKQFAGGAYPNTETTH
jgi:hypothetical protein